MNTENYYYGKSSNPVDSLPKTGKRTLNLEKEVTVTNTNILDSRKSGRGDEGEGRGRGKN